ncbi:membrane protein [Tateyamaria omphalii]|uniref:DMT family transporter n=1 Tax=Tateyamaria omphalii TaxID=299262 RepID=UPI00167828A2|nr:DMT family transporter [Tateyamaria omphalii]GGX65308.1 membrane protein [Tateyamaria omphalii]
MAEMIKNTSYKRLPPLPFAVLLLGGSCLGVAPVIVKSIDLSPEASAFYRVALSAPLFAIGAALFAQNIKASAQPVLRLNTKVLCLLTAFIFALDLVLMHMAIRLSDVAVATLLTNCAPFFVGILGLIGLTSRPDMNFWVMLPIALAGCALLIGTPQGDGQSQVLGNVLALSAAFCYACYVVGVTELRKRGLSTLTIMSVVTIVSTVFLLPLFAMQGFPAPQSMQTIMMLLVLVLIGQMLGQGLTTLALKDLPSSLSSLVLLVQPIVAGALSWYFLSEILNGIQLLGMFMVLAAIAGAAFIPANTFRQKIRKPKLRKVASKLATDDVH